MDSMHDLKPSPRDRGLAMLGLLRRQATLYDRLETLAQQQHGLLASADAQPLLKVLAQRQRLTGELQALGVQMKPLRDDWEQVRTALPATERAEAERLVNDARLRLSRLLAADEEDAQRLRIHKQNVGESLRGLRTSQHAINAYRTQAADTNCLDRMHDES